MAQLAAGDREALAADVVAVAYWRGDHGGGFLGTEMGTRVRFEQRLGQVIYGPGYDRGQEQVGRDVVRMDEDGFGADEPEPD